MKQRSLITLTGSMTIAIALLLPAPESSVLSRSFRTVAAASIFVHTLARRAAYRR